MSDLWIDLKTGWRQLRRHRGHLGAAVLSMALGIGAATATFSVVDAVLLQPLPYVDPQDLVQIEERNPAKGWDHFTVAPAKVLDWRQRAGSFADIAGYMSWVFNLSGVDSPERLQGARASASLFRLLGAEFSAGRGFRDEEDQEGAPQVVVLSHDLWQRRFGADPDLVGKTLQLNGEPVEVVGVTGPGFRFPEDAELWIPLAMGSYEASLRDRHYLSVLGRLGAETSLESARSEMSALAAHLAQEHPDTDRGWEIVLTPLQQKVVGDSGEALALIFGAVLLMLLLACANVANLLLAWAEDRGLELAVRSATGAGLGRLVRQWLTETLLLATLGGLLGAGLAYAAVRATVRFDPGDIPRIEEVGFDSKIFAFALGLALLTGLLTGLPGLFRITRTELRSVLHEEASTATLSRSRFRVRSLLVVSQIALALVLLGAAGLTTRTLWNLARSDPGFAVDHRLTLRLALPGPSYPEGRQQVAFFDRLLRDLESLPGVESAAAVNALPFSGTQLLRGFDLEGASGSGAEDRPSAGWRVVTPGYFETLGVPVVEGRSLTPQDRDDARPVAVVNRAMARAFWAGDSPLGGRLTIDQDIEQPRTIVGVVGDVLHSSLDAEPEPEVYVPLRQKPWSWMTLVLHTRIPPLDLAETVRSRVLRLDPNQPVYDVQTLEERLGSSLSRQRFATFLLLGFAAAAVLLAVVGVYSVIAQAVGRRRREMAIRMAMGASRAQVRKHLLGNAILLTLLGLGAGTALAVGLGRWLESRLFGWTAADLSTLLVLGLLLGALGALAGYLPTRRVASTDPAGALRDE